MIIGHSGWGYSNNKCLTVFNPEHSFIVCVVVIVVPMVMPVNDYADSELFLSGGVGEEETLVYGITLTCTELEHANTGQYFLIMVHEHPFCLTSGVRISAILERSIM